MDETNDYDYNNEDSDNENDNESIDESVENKKVVKKPQKKNDVEQDDIFLDDEEDDEEEYDEEDEEEDADDDDENEENEDIILSKIQSKEFNNSPFLNMENFNEDTDTDNEDEDDDEDYLQKFDEKIQQKIIENYHPELIMHNNDEIDILSKVVRNENGTIIDPLHKTVPFITKYEKARILGERAKQLNSGANSMIEIDPSIIDGYLIALKEFEEKKIPFIIKRPLPNGGCEYWKISDLEVLF